MARALFLVRIVLYPNSAESVTQPLDSIQG